ncbi:MAG TPA: hypothetical protein VNS09_04585 [Solirubrobacter sp.]|nr:hypothetical protein [Solirubrobacter sp.]
MSGAAPARRATRAAAAPGTPNAAAPGTPRAAAARPSPPADATALRALLALALRASSGRHADAARNVVLAILLAQLLAGAAHEGPPHAPRRPSRRRAVPRPHHAHRSSLSGRRPRG